MSWFSRCSWSGGPFNGGNCRCCTNVSFGDEFVRNPDPISYDETPDFSFPPPQPQYETYSLFTPILLFEEFRKREQAANLSTYTTKPSRRFNSLYYDDDYEESTIPLNEIVSQIPPEVIKSSVEDLVPIPSESEDTSGSDSKCDLPSCNDFSPINVYKEKSMTFSNPLFDSNDDFTSSDDESLSDEDVPKDNRDFESKDSYVSNLDEPALLVTPLSDANKAECFDP
ncbi:hypothetical protein Tco_1259071 [Tanacetum coccineum]